MRALKAPAHREGSTGAGRPLFPALLGSVLIVATAVWWPWPILARDGWPMNHEGLSIFERVEDFRRAFVQGCWYPLWTPYLQKGYGSAYPLLYHRLYASVAALIAMASGSVIMAVKSLTVLLLATGGLGMRRLLRVSGASEPLAVLGSVLLLISPYTTTDWLVRGAMAEFLAFMLLPWLYAELCLFLQGRRHWVRGAILIVLLFHAHSMICYYFLVSAIGFLGYSLAGSRRVRAWSGIGDEKRRILAGALIIVVGTVPHALVAASMLPYFNTDLLAVTPSGVVRISKNYQPFAHYLADDSFRWGEQWRKLSVEVNRYVCVAALALHLLPGAAPRWRGVFRVPLYSFLLAWLLVCLLLQLPAFGLLFALLPKAQFIQFPWRLLAFMNIGALFVLVAAAQAALLAGRSQRSVAAACLVFTLGFSLHHWSASRSAGEMIAPSAIEEARVRLDGRVSIYGEYLLKGMDPRAGLPDRAFVDGTGCPRPLIVKQELDHRGFWASAETDRPCRVSLRQFQTPILEIELQNARLLSPTPATEIVIELEPGASTIRLRPRSLGQMLRQQLSGASALFAR